MLSAAAEEIRSDPAWESWWQPAGMPELEIHLTYDAERAGEHRVRGGKRRAQADVYLGFDRLAPSDPEIMVRYACEDCLTAMDSVREKFSLAELPPLAPSGMELPR